MSQIRPQPRDTLISIVLPVYNEAKVLPELLRRVTRSAMVCGGQHEIIFVNDGSRDRGAQVLDRLARSDSRVRVVHLSRNFGHQAAVQAGLVRARGDAVILMDSDLQDAPEAIVRFVEQWREGADVVYALRTQRKENVLKRFLFAAFHRLMSAVATVDIPADAGIFGLIDRRVARELVAMGENDRYFPGLRSWVGFRQKGIVVERNARYDDHPRVSLRGLFRLAKTAMFSFSTLPLAIFHVIGAVAAVLFVALSSFSLFCKLFTDLAVPGWASYVLVGSFFGALNALGISILGEYVVRIYDQVRGRPLYVIERTVNVDSDRLGEVNETRALADDATGDRPYLDLVREAEELLEAASPRPGQVAATGEEEPAAMVIPFPKELY
jgi:dolichol-phosphate mannosyltransferase